MKAEYVSRLQQILYLGRRAGAMLALIACLDSASLAQRGDRRNRPEIAPQNEAVKKKITGEPRALALLQLTDKGKATLVPIAILIDGKFYDASVYKATPVPMALESGIVYEGERTGSSLGLFTVSGVLRGKDPNASPPWIGTGQWLPQGAEEKKTAHKAEDVPVGLVTTDEPPRLTKSGIASKDAGTDSAAPNSGQASAKPPDASPSTPAQKVPAQTKADQGTTAPTTPAPSKPEASTASASGSSKSDQAAPAPGEDTNSQATDSNRPKLRRGKPTTPLPSDADVPGYAKVGDAKPSATAPALDTKPDITSGKAGASAAADSPPQLIPAISDSAGPDPRSFVYAWSKSEEDDRRKDVLVLAQQQLHAYLQERAKNSIAAKSSSTKAVPVKAASSTGKPLAKMPDLVLEDLQIRTFDLWATNQPIIVLTAKAHPPLPAVGSAAASNPAPEYSIALVARTDIYNNLHKLYVGVTDKYHLDVTPRLELIDAVDADGDGRGELLFRETSDAGSGYIIYRATGDTLWKMFDSLSAE